MTTETLDLILLGPPGAGKGTQAERLNADLALPHISTGGMLRAEVQRGSKIGSRARVVMERGELVPDDVIAEMLLARLQSGDCQAGFVLDGFPRTSDQARVLDEALSQVDRAITSVLVIAVPDDEIVSRVSGRWLCEASGHVFNERSGGLAGGVCEKDGSSLYQRSDDNSETVRRRLSVYHQQTAPLIRIYQERGLLTCVDGTKEPEEVYAQLRLALGVRG